ncbi:hypothetical protein VB796_06565 [Arcicella sp. LKC2W]|uniref:hypothetical protein n=1 Tax=Arcicella sp. LKC2W TaxID=2984198 RepID=UPI002B1F3BCE|nr:hypothetical protein [Arcicella sp. LKC2W]MEA5458690.1 hypothetical protein [Arcicella sp. LKC2W]
MSNNTTTAQNGKAISMPTQLATTPKANESKIITVQAEEIKPKPTISHVFERLQEGILKQEYFEKASTRMKEVSEFNREAKEGAGLILTGILPSGRKIEFLHLQSNLEFLNLQEERGREHVKFLEEEIQNFTIA